MWNIRGGTGFDFNTGHVKEEMIPWYQGGNSQYTVGSTYNVYNIQTLVKKKEICVYIYIITTRKLQ